MRGNFENSLKLAKLILRRERIMSTVWIVLLGLFSIALAPAIGEMFDDVARASFAETFNNPAMIAMMGPVYGVENYTAGAMYSNAMLLWVIIAVAVMNILLVVRHTRADEERSRAEVVRSLPTGRLANLNATMIVAFIVNTTLALITGVGIAVLGVESMDWPGSLLYGVALGVSGLLFAAIAALFSQLSASSRGATGLSFAVLGAAYLLRAAGDMGNEILSFISPMGLIQRSMIYVENHAWPVWVVLAEAVAVAVIAYGLNAVRDMDQGFIPAKPGRKDASSLLQSPLGLAFRLLRNMLLAWLAGVFLLGASYGSILGDIEEFVANSEFYSMVIGANDQFTTAQMFVSMVTSIISLIGLVPVLTAILKVRGEEKEERTEHILSRVVSRMKYLSSYTIIAFLTSVLVQCTIAISIYVVGVSVLSDPGDLTLGYLLKANLVYLPGIWVMIGLTVLLVGLLPKATGVIWGYYGFVFFVSFMGRIPNLMPEWVGNFCLYNYIPQLPADSINYGTLCILTVFAAALTALGFVFYKRRDVQA